MTNAVLAAPPAEPADAVAYFAAKLAHHTDVADVHAALHSEAPGFVLVDSRGRLAWEQAHIAGAVHLSTAEIPSRATTLLDLSVPVVVHCWGPGCDGATRAALALARLGYQVKEMIGGIEYWIREGYPVATSAGRTAREPDTLTAPIGPPSCGC